MLKNISPIMTDTWQLLGNEKECLCGISLSDMFKGDHLRANRLSIKTNKVYFDYSRQLVMPETINLLVNLANETGLKDKIESMFNGDIVNITEKRSALHTALRGNPDNAIFVNKVNVMDDITRVLSKVERYSNEVISGKRLGITGKKLKNIISVGIGGSYLGVDYLATALKNYTQDGMNLVFVSNVDGTDFYEKTKSLNPEETIIIIISKTFTTAETMKNANTIRDWLLKALKRKGIVSSENEAKKAISKHFIAVSAESNKVTEFGIDKDNMFEFWDWVGGRYSATSAVGAVPLSIYLGYSNFKKILEGANWMDEHFRYSPFNENIPVLSALIDIWNINFWGYKTRALLPYSQALSKLPAHTQQVEMESNGKSVDNEGNFIDYDTGEVIFGEAGTNGQHSFYQLIHQGKQIIPCDFIGFIKPQYEVGQSNPYVVTHHDELMTNFFAQPDALAFGDPSKYPYKHFSGNRPSSSLLLEKLDPFTAGLLLAWTEHRTVVKGFIWNIDSFDQWGVELGKTLGQKIRNEMLKNNNNPDYIANTGNSSTDIMLNAFLNRK